MRKLAAITAILLTAIWGESAATAAYIYSFSALPASSTGGKNTGQFVWSSPSLVSSNVILGSSNLTSCSLAGGSCGTVVLGPNVTEIPSMRDVADAVYFGGYTYSFDNHALSNIGSYPGNLVEHGLPGAKVASLSIKRESSYSAANVGQLALASANAYSTLPSKIGDFVPLEPHVLPDGLKMQAYVTPDEGQAIFAVRGTQTDIFKNLLTDATVGSGIDNATTDQYLKEASSYLRELVTKYDHANFQITGHSLGGSIAQVIGKVSGLSSTAFDAPGAFELYTTQASRLNQISGMGPGYGSVNYRLYGDQWSLFGTQIDRTVTVSDNNSSFYTALTILNSNGIKILHDPSLLASDIVSGNFTQSDGIQGPNLVSNNLLILFGAPLAGNVSIYASAYEHYLIDPSGYESFIFEGRAGSPFFNTVTLPSIEGVDRYRLNYLIGGDWTQTELLLPLSEYSFPIDVTGFRFSAYGKSDRVLNLNDPFLFDVSFSSSGQFDGTLSGFSAGVPEPSLWCMLIMGFGIVGWYMRRSLARTSVYQSALRKHIV